MDQYLKELFEEMIGVAPRTGAVQIRYHRRQMRNVRIENGVLKTVSSSLVAGAGIRVRNGGIWGFSCTSKISKDSLFQALKDATDAAHSGSTLKASSANLVVFPVRGTLSVRETTPVNTVSLEEKINLVRQADSIARNLNPKIVSSAVSYLEMMDDKIIVTSYGSSVSVHDVKIEFRVNVVAADGNEMEYGTASVGATGGLGELFRQMKPDEMSEHAVKSAIDKLGAEMPSAGIYTVVLHPSLVGILAHEAIGHTVEADMVLSGSVVRGRIGEKLASDKITLVDDPLPSRDYAAAGVLLVDDEGNKPEKTTIIDCGVLKSYLHDAETAGIFGVHNTGNARAYTYEDEPLIRMRNTYVEPGKDSLEEMISSTREGFYLEGLGMSGQADANAEFMFGIQQAWKIENGRRTKPMKGVTISGQAFEVLSSADMVGTDFLLPTGAGYCGKHQPAKVDGGGPHIRCRMKIGGAL